MNLNLMEQLVSYLNLDLICIATYNTKEPYEYYYGYETISNSLSGVYFIEKKFTREDWNNNYQNNTKIRSFVLHFMKSKKLLDKVKENLSQNLFLIKNEQLFKTCLEVLCQEK